MRGRLRNRQLASVCCALLSIAPSLGKTGMNAFFLLELALALKRRRLRVHDKAYLSQPRQSLHKRKTYPSDANRKKFAQIRRIAVYRLPVVLFTTRFSNVAGHAA